MLKFDSTNRKRLYKYGFFGIVAKRKPLLSKNKMAAWLRFAKFHLQKPQDIRDNGQTSPKQKCVAMMHNDCQKSNTAYQQIQLIPTVKHSCGGVKIWVCFAAKVPEHLAVTESTINSSV